jgi:hypothetical protein
MKTKNEKAIEHLLTKSIKFKKELMNSKVNTALYNSLIGKINEVINLLS